MFGEKIILKINIILLSIIRLAAAPTAAAAHKDNTESLENVTKTIGNLLEGYDIRLRPNFGGKFNKERV